MPDLLDSLLEERQRRGNVLSQPVESVGAAARTAASGAVGDLLSQLTQEREKRRLVTGAQPLAETRFEPETQVAEATAAQIDLPYQAELTEILTVEDEIRDLIGEQLPGDLSQGERWFSDDTPETIRRIGINLLKGAAKFPIDIEERFRKDPAGTIPELAMEMPKAILGQVNEWLEASGIGLEINPDFKIKDLLAAASPVPLKTVFLGNPLKVQSILRNVPPEQMEAARQNLVENPIGTALMLLPFAKGALRVSGRAAFRVATKIEDITSAYGGNLKTTAGRNAANIVRNWHSEIQIAYDKAARWRKYAQKGLKAQEKEDLIFYLQRTHNPFMVDRVWRRDAGYVTSPRLVYERLSPKARQAAWGLKQRFKELRDQINKSGAAEELAFRKDYVTQFWRGTPEAMAKAHTHFRRHNPFAKERVFESYAEGMKIPGLTPKYRDIFDILEQYERINARVVQNNSLVKSFADLAAGHFDRPSLLSLAKQAEAELGRQAKRTAKRKAPDTPEEAAEQFGLKFEGTWEHPKKMPDGTIRITREYGFTDPVTEGSSINVKTLSDIGSDLTKHRKIHGKPPPEMPDPVADVRLNYFGKGGVEAATDAQLIQYLDHLADKTGLKLDPQFSSLITTSQKAPVTYVPIKSRALARATAGYGDEVSVHPDIARPIRTVFEEPISSPLIKTVELVNAFSKKLALTASFFHHIALAESALYSGVLPTSFRKGLDLLKDRRFRRDMIRHDLDITTPSDVMRGHVRGALKDLERATRDMKVLGKGTKLFRQANDVWDGALWDYYHPGLKAYVYHEKVHAMLNKYPNATRSQMTKIKRAVATHVNNAFGGQNWDTLLKSAKWRQMAHLTFLAPDWTLSNIKIATTAFKTRRGGLGASVEGQLARRYWLRAGLVFYTVSNLANYALSGHWMWENEKDRQFSIDTGTKDEKGRRTYVVASKQVREPVRWLLEPFKEAGRKAAPVLQILSEQFPGYSLSGYPTELAKRKKYGDEVGMWETLFLRAKAVGRHAVPFSLGEYNVGFAFPMRKGRSPKQSQKWVKTKVLDLYMEAKERNRPHLIKEANDLILYQALHFPEHPISISFEDIERRVKAKIKKEAEADGR